MYPGPRVWYNKENEKIVERMIEYAIIYGFNP